MNVVDESDGVYYETLFSERLADVVGAADASIRMTTDRVQHNMAAMMKEVAARGYAAGLRDGFAQGVAAEVKRRSDEPGLTEIEARRRS